VKRHGFISTPLGPVRATEEDGALTGLTFAEEAGPAVVGALLEETARQITAYFAGILRAFTVPVRLKGTPFQEAVWAALQSIRYGETVTYAELAERAGHPGAARAAGAAAGANPVLIVVPCHRVTGPKGQLTGYAGGLDVKRRLLALERGERGLWGGA
jgi:methylated-DNA-[protein]-cysteine S-methyltransferase